MAESSAAAPKRRGRKRWVPTEEDILKIRIYAGLGSTKAQIGAIMGVTPDTLNKHERVRDAFEAGKAETITKVAGKVVEAALKGNLSAAIFYLKTQAGWRETNRIEHAIDGEALTITVGMSAKQAAEAYRAELG